MTREQLEAAGVLLKSTDGTMLLALHVQPGAKTTEIVGLHGDRLKVRLAAPPVDGKANKALIAWAATHFTISKSCVTLVRGQSSRRKLLKLQLS